MSTEVCRLGINEIDLLRDIAYIREKNKRLTLEREAPTPARILQLILRNPKIRQIISTEICLLPTKEAYNEIYAEE
jgi:hypothetical protein